MDINFRNLGVFIQIYIGISSCPKFIYWKYIRIINFYLPFLFLLYLMTSLHITKRRFFLIALCPGPTAILWPIFHITTMSFSETSPTFYEVFSHPDHITLHKNLFILIFIFEH